MILGSSEAHKIWTVSLRGGTLCCSSHISRNSASMIPFSCCNVGNEHCLWRTSVSKIGHFSVDLKELWFHISYRCRILYCGNFAFSRIPLNSASQDMHVCTTLFRKHVITLLPMRFHLSCFATTLLEYYISQCRHASISYWFNKTDARIALRRPTQARKSISLL